MNDHKSTPPKLLDILTKLLETPSVAGREYLLTDYISQELYRAQCQVHLQTVLGAGGPNIIASRGSGGPWFVTHIDVYPAYDHPHPFTPQFENEIVTARGAVDTKGQIAALIYSLQQTREPVQLALVVDEEQLGRGSEALEVPSSISGAIILEPTNMQIGIAEAGSIGIEAQVSGYPTHGSTPWQGISAIESAFDQYKRLLDQSFMYHEHPLFPRGGWVNLGRIEGGYDTMVVPPRCLMELEVGFAPGLAAQDIANQVYQALRQSESVHITDIWDPWETRQDEHIVQTLFQAYSQGLGQEPRFHGMPSWTDGAHLVRKGIPTVVFGAGDLAVAHTWHESVSINEIDDLHRVIKALIENRTQTE